MSFLVDGERLSPLVVLLIHFPFRLALSHIPLKSHKGVSMSCFTGCPGLPCRRPICIFLYPQILFLFLSICHWFEPSHFHLEKNVSFSHCTGPGCWQQYRYSKHLASVCPLRMALAGPGGHLNHPAIQLHLCPLHCFQTGWRHDSLHQSLENLG